MITEDTVEIEAPAPVVWSVYAQVDRWPEWTASVTSVVPKDGADLAIGRRYAIKQPWLPEVVWEVTEFEHGSGWIWRQRSPGAIAYAVHRVEPRGETGTLVRQRIEQRGPLGSLVGLLIRGLTRRYLALEAQGLKAAAEARFRNAASA